MAKKHVESKTAVHDAGNKTPKKSGTGAVIGSIVLFILTLLMAVLLLCSSTLALSLQQHSVEKAVQQTNFSQLEWTDDGITQNFGQWIYTWYMDGAPNLTPEYAQAALSHTETKAVLCDYLAQLRTYLLGESDDLPQLDAAAFVDVLQYDIAAKLEQETGVTFTDADRSYVLWATDEDFPEWNDTVSDLVGGGIGKTVIRFFCTLPGVITAGALTVVMLILWLIFAIKGHWRKGRMLTGIGVSVAVPSLLVLLSSGILLLLVDVLDVIAALSFLSNGLSLILVPAILPSLGYLLCGVVIAAIGICTNTAGKARCAKKQQSETNAEPKTETAAPQPEEVPTASEDAKPTPEPEAEAPTTETGV